MNTIKHDDVEARYGDNIELEFTVRDRAGSLVALGGATFTYRVANKLGDANLLEKTEADGTMADSVITIPLDTADLPSEGTYADQLRVTKSGKPLVVSEGKLILKPLIS